MDRLRGAKGLEGRADLLPRACGDKPGIFHHFCEGSFSHPNGCIAAQPRSDEGRTGDYGNSFKPSSFKNTLCLALAATTAFSMSTNC